MQYGLCLAQPAKLLKQTTLKHRQHALIPQINWSYSVMWFYSNIATRVQLKPSCSSIFSQVKATNDCLAKFSC